MTKQILSHNEIKTKHWYEYSLSMNPKYWQWFRCYVIDVGERGFTLECPHIENECGSGLQFCLAGGIKFRSAV